MLSKQITAVALRLMALWLLVKLILSLPTYAMMLGAAGTVPEDSAPALLLLLIGVFLLVGLLAAWLIHRAANAALARVEQAAPDATAALGPQDQKLLFQLLGLYFLIAALAGLPDALAFLPYWPQASWQSFLRPAGLLFQLGMGLWLAAGASFWCRLFHRLRGH
ncbi:hypothetical protein [Halomonas garicola]|uniref:hypothetical protein n=1 Tax=Halomonas garicola TaxID=1690008 RepID=UPI0028984661|nr:hypothetical protein [Halomonas garicola]